MSDLKIEVFTSPTCPNCPAAVRATKELLAANKELGGRVLWKELSTATPQGRRKAAKYGIRSVPTIIMSNSRGGKGGIVGTPTQEKYLEVVREMMGEGE